MPKVRQTQFASAWRQDEGGARGSSGDGSEVSDTVEPRLPSLPPFLLTRCHEQGMRVWRGMERASRRRRFGAALIRGSAGGEGWREALEISGGGSEGRVVGGGDSWGLGGPLQSQRVFSSLLEERNQKTCLVWKQQEDIFKELRVR